MKILSEIKHHSLLIICVIAFALCLSFAGNLRAQSWGGYAPAVQAGQKSNISGTGMEKSTAELAFEYRAEQEAAKDICPLIAELQAKYAKDCWICPVLRQLTDSFVGAATVALGLSQEAGIFLLKLGTILWILLWGLRHVSSMAQVEPANILSELLKFLFKVILAYAFIYAGARAISTYFTNPIMGLGAKIAETFWEEERIKPHTEEYVWAEITEEDEAELQKIIDEERQNYMNNEGQQGASDGQSGTGGSETSVIQNGEDGAGTDYVPPATGPIQPVTYNGTVPSFIIPPVDSGSITSPAGCRKHPEYKVWKLHKGLDIGGNNGVTIVASADGAITYRFNSGDTSCSKGYGCYAIITHAGGWSSVYAHMPCEVCHNPPASGSVKKGQPIGIVGNTGTSTGPHLHFEVKQNGRAVEPLHLLAGEILYIDETCNAQVGATPFPYGMYPYIHVSQIMDKEANHQEYTIVNSTTSGSTGAFDFFTPPTSSGTNTESYEKYSQKNYTKYDYDGSSVILSEAIVNSMIGAAQAIGNITAENMILGEAVMCFAGQEKGGAMKIKIGERLTGEGIIVANFTNPIMWLEGAFIWVTGFLLTMAYAFYLVDIAFKIGFAIIALPIAAGLWPFEMTKDKLGVCISILAKASATFAFLALTTSFTVYLTEATYNYEEIEVDEVMEGENTGGGLSRLYSAFDDTTNGTATADDIKYASAKLEIFSMTFVLLLFSFLYSFKLVRKTVPDLVNKFFPDKAFGDSSPMHQWSTAATKAVKDIAMKPVGYARDIALHQGGKLAQKGVGKLGNAAAKGVQGVGRGVQSVGRGLSSAGKSLQSVPVVGQIVGGALMAAGAVTRAAGKGVEATGKVAEKVNDTATQAGNKKEDKSEKKKDEGDK